MISIKFSVIKPSSNLIICSSDIKMFLRGLMSPEGDCLIILLPNYFTDFNSQVDYLATHKQTCSQ